MPRAPYAMRDDQTQGRRHQEQTHPYRSEFQRDRDRIIHAKAFRRLENKTQVFDPDYSDHFRNRLTHTIEVSQIARTLSEALGLNTDLCEVLALSHDIGHPPFSHTGEEVLNRIMRQYDSGFEHNLHGLRIVEYFEEKYPAFPGLNLTFEVREGIVKHSRDYAETEAAYVDIREYRLGERPPLEAQIIDFADEIAYNAADLDDGSHSGLLSLAQILSNVSLFRTLYQAARERFPKATEKLLISETIRRLIDALTTSLLNHTRETIGREGIDSVRDVRTFSGRLPGFDAEMSRKNQELKQFLRDALYNHEVLRKGREKAQHLIQDLFDDYLRHPEALPQSHYSRIKHLNLHRVVCDYIAGMTDKYVQAKWSELKKLEGEPPARPYKAGSGQV